MNKKYLYLSLLSLGLVACGQSTETIEDATENHADTTQVVEIVEEEIVEEVAKIDFSKFDHYATILTKTDLIAEFGEENLEDKTAWFAEGTVERKSTVLTNPNNGHIVKYIWADSDNETTAWIEATHYVWGEDYGVEGTQELEAENGLKLGMSLAELRAWNGDDFRFSGFGWDYAGGVFAEEGSKLTDSKVQVRLMNDQVESNEGFDFMIGDVELHADDENLKNAPVLVEQFSLYIDHE